MGNITEEVLARAPKHRKYPEFCTDATGLHYSEHVVLARAYGLEAPRADVANQGFGIIGTTKTCKHSRPGLVRVRSTISKHGKPCVSW